MRAVPDSYVEYPNRRGGMDHDRYAYRGMPGQPLFEWPNGDRLALTAVVAVELFRFDDRELPLRPIASPMVEYPDYWGYTRLEYGSRAGIERVVQALDALDVPVAAAINSEICDRYPRVAAEVIERGWEIVGHGASASILFHEGMGEAEEEGIIAGSLEMLRGASDQAVRGWLSPSLSESSRTLDLLAKHGVEYVLDWVNDDVPYEVRTAEGTMYSVPYSHELSDRRLIGEQVQTTWDYVDQVLCAARRLLDEAAEGMPRVLSLPMHPWIMGVPHRATHLEALLAGLRDLDGIWWTTPGAVARAYERAVAP